MGASIANLCGGMVELTNGWTQAPFDNQDHWFIARIDNEFKKRIEGYSFILIILKDGGSGAKTYNRHRYCLIQVADFLDIANATDISTGDAYPIGLESANTTTIPGYQRIVLQDKGDHSWNMCVYSNGDGRTTVRHYKMFGIKL
jgi:hypothetical protein